MSIYAHTASWFEKIGYNYGQCLFPIGRIHYGQGKSLHPEAINLRGELDGLFFTYTLRLEFRYKAGQTTEAGYAFSIPNTTALLNLELVKNGKQYKSMVIAKSELSGTGRQPDDKQPSGRLFCIDELCGGMHGANIGETKEGDSISIIARCAALLDMEGGLITFALPYRDVQEACLQIFLRLKKSFGELDIASCTYPVTIHKGSGDIAVTLKSPKLTGCDFILNLRPARLCGVLRSSTTDLHVAVASYTPLAENKRKFPLFLKILVDCSGSMQDVAAEYLKKGLLQLADHLHPEDHLAFSKFGDHVWHLWRTPRPCQPRFLREFTEAVDEMQADMGGTNLEDALLSSFSRITRTEQVDLAPMLLLITDGQVGDIDRAILAANKSGHAIFVIGAGEYPHILLLREIATRTGGNCEIAQSDEDIPDAILRMFRSLSHTIGWDVYMKWPGQPLCTVNAPPYLVTDRTIHCLAMYPKRCALPEEERPMLLYRDQDGEHKISFDDSAEIPSDELARYACLRFVERRPSHMLDLAMACNLLTKETLMVLVDNDIAYPTTQEVRDEIENARIWNDGLFLSQSDILYSRSLSHASWLERQQNARKRP